MLMNYTIKAQGVDNVHLYNFLENGGEQGRSKQGLSNRVF